ncbi:DUF7673 family protein [Ramlibacter algicola]|uniref:DUF7673 domain-containing protein n=1 Tax=Ramlibacter algicola TaxID=2795217 RepID=A0A934PYL1_9BURK|nr:hypothetical protein [Ramlibacter algicola]MBK0391049.1 hypothetical protein [Ramlibacter algicola]
MSQADRKRRHQARLARIEQVQVVAGHAGRGRVDHEATLLERARMLDEELAAHQATEAGLAAFDRLLKVVELRGTARTPEVTELLDALWNRHPLPLAVLRGVEPRVADDMLALLDAFRWSRVDLVTEVTGGPRRVAKVLAAAPPQLESVVRVAR